MKWDFELLVLKYTALRFRLLDRGQRGRFVNYFVSLNDEMNKKEAAKKMKEIPAPENVESGPGILRPNDIVTLTEDGISWGKRGRARSNDGVFRRFDKSGWLWVIKDGQRSAQCFHPRFWKKKEAA
jgi:hypothetical protein